MKTIQIIWWFIVIYLLVLLGLHVEATTRAKECVKSDPIVIMCNRPKTSYETTREKLIKIWLSYEISEHITWECNNIKDKNLIQKCVTDILCASAQESSMLKNCNKNNCFGLMESGQVISFDNKLESITKFVDNWEKVYHNFQTPDSRIKANYCYSSWGVGCIWWTGSCAKAQNLYLSQ